MADSEQEKEFSFGATRPKRARSAGDEPQQGSSKRQALQDGAILWDQVDRACLGRLVREVWIPAAQSIEEEFLKLDKEFRQIPNKYAAFFSSCRMAEVSTLSDKEVARLCPNRVEVKLPHAKHWKAIYQSIGSFIYSTQAASQTTTDEDVVISALGQTFVRSQLGVANWEILRKALDAACAQNDPLFSSYMAVLIFRYCLLPRQSKGTSSSREHRRLLFTSTSGAMGELIKPQSIFHQSCLEGMLAGKAGVVRVAPGQFAYLSSDQTKQTAVSGGIPSFLPQVPGSQDLQLVGCYNEVTRGQDEHLVWQEMLQGPQPHNTELSWFALGTVGSQHFQKFSKVRVISLESVRNLLRAVRDTKNNPGDLQIPKDLPKNLYKDHSMECLLVDYCVDVLSKLSVLRHPTQFHVVELSTGIDYSVPTFMVFSVETSPVKDEFIITQLVRSMQALTEEQISWIQWQPFFVTRAGRRNDFDVIRKLAQQTVTERVLGQPLPALAAESPVQCDLHALHPQLFGPTDVLSRAAVLMGATDTRTAHGYARYSHKYNTAVLLAFLFLCKIVRFPDDLELFPEKHEAKRFVEIAYKAIRETANDFKAESDVERLVFDGLRSVAPYMQQYFEELEPLANNSLLDVYDLVPINIASIWIENGLGRYQKDDPDLRKWFEFLYVLFFARYAYLTPCQYIMGPGLAKSNFNFSYLNDQIFFACPYQWRAQINPPLDDATAAFEGEMYDFVYRQTSRLLFADAEGNAERSKQQETTLVKLEGLDTMVNPLQLPSMTAASVAAVAVPEGEQKSKKTEEKEEEPNLQQQMQAKIDHVTAGQQYKEAYLPSDGDWTEYYNSLIVSTSADNAQIPWLEDAGELPGPPVYFGYVPGNDIVAALFVLKPDRFQVVPHSQYPDNPENLRVSTEYQDLEQGVDYVLRFLKKTE